MEDPSQRASDDAATLVEGGKPACGPPRLAKGDSVGRYVILELAGRGGMGRVYKAYDPKLKREVALKLLRTNDAELEQRAVREAQAMASLSHPNVVPVYDVDRDDGRLYIAMEFIPGQTMRRWLKGRDPSKADYREVLGIMVQVGRGLAAAHQADLVHRDLKPANIVLGEDGRVRVMDFGLARGGGLETDTGDFSDKSAEVTGPLTRMGAVVGTPSYMPPEQHRAGNVDERSDQFAYCVVFYEALFGHRPFDADRLEGLAQLKERGLSHWPSEPDVPTWLARAIRRGLSPRPSGRFSSMDAMLGVLDRHTNDAGRRWPLIAGGGIAALGVGALVLSHTAESDAPEALDPCAESAQTVDALWGPAPRQTVESTLGGADLPFASDSAQRVTRLLDGYAQRLTAARYEACAATEIRHEQSEPLRDRRFACLDRASSALGSAVRELSTPDASVARNAVRIVLGLPDVQRCADHEVLLAALPRPDDPAIAAEVDAIEARLEETRVKRRAGHHDQALADAQELLRSAQRVDYGPVEAEATYLLGRLQSKTGEYEKARDTLQRAYHVAIAAGHDAVAADAAAELTFVVGGLLQDHTRGQMHAEDSRAWSDKVGTDDARARHENIYATLLQQMGQYKEAQRRFELALEIRERTSEPDSLPIANALNNLANVLMDQGKPEEAAKLYARARAIGERLFGEDHVTVVAFVNNLANAKSRQGLLNEAWPLYERALSVYIDTYGEEHPDVAGFRLNMAGTAWRRGRLDEAATLYATALATQRMLLEPNHPKLAQSLAAYGALELERERIDEAAELLEESLRINEAAYAHDHPQIASSLERLALVDLERQAFETAVQRLERAASIRATTESTEADRAQGEFILARALLGQGQRERAIATAEAAAKRVDTTDDDFREEVQRWLETNRG